VDALVAAWGDPSVAQANRVPTDASPDGARRWICGESQRRDRGLALDLVIGPTGGDLVWGEVGLRGFDMVVGRAEIGWWLAPAVRGWGLASAAVGLLTAWALAPPLGLRQVWARVGQANRASAHVAAAAGFRRLGTAGGSDIWSREAMPNGAPTARQ
jgi:RimJ/RimL family protein N-acetyltransferase